MSIATEITRLQKAKSDIKSAIESKGVTVGDGNIDTYAEKINAIQGGGGDNLLTAMWNGIQNNGARTDYQQAFRNWKNMHDYWYPLYDISGGSYIFYAVSSNMGLPEMCERAGGIKINWRVVNTFNQCFSYADIPDVGVIDFTAERCTSTSSCFMNSYVQKAHIILKTDGSQTHAGGCFTGASKLTDLTVEGAIGNSLPIPSPLTPESMISVITHLVNYKGTDKEGVNAITFTEECWEALEAHSIAPDGGSWKNYVTSLGWRS